MRKPILISLAVILFMTAVVSAETRTLKVSVDSLVNEIDLDDNNVEKEVTIVDQGFSDLGILDITASPSYVVVGSSIRTADLRFKVYK